MFYVDDGLVAARSVAEADSIVDMVAKLFPIHKLGEPSDMLGLEVERDRRAGEKSIRQAAKAKGLAEAFRVAGDRRTIPMRSAVYGSLKCAKPGDETADKTAYQSGIGSLLHMAQCVRPDIAARVGALAAFGSAPTAVHFAAMLDVIGYVGATAERGISYGHSDVAVKIWCDANFAACMDTRRSRSGWVVVCFGGAVSWESCKQPTAAASTMEAEYQACGAVAREGLRFRKLLREFHVFCEALKLNGPLMIHCENKAALSLCSDRKETKRANILTLCTTSHVIMLQVGNYFSCM
jgi:hypothetical protein